MNLGFCVQGTLFLVGAVAARGAGLFSALAGVNAAGNVLIAVFHSGSSAHAAGAVLAIVGGNAAVLAGSSVIGGWHRRVSLGLGVFGLLSFAMFALDLQAATVPLGLLERSSVYPITMWQLLTAGWLFTQRSTSRARFGSTVVEGPPITED